MTGQLIGKLPGPEAIESRQSRGEETKLLPQFDREDN